MIDIKRNLKDLWAGETSLAQTFWIYCFFGIFFLSYIGVEMKLAFVNLVALLWAGYMAAPIWRAADNFPGLKFYSIMAKVGYVVFAFIALKRLLSYGQ